MIWRRNKSEKGIDWQQLTQENQIQFLIEESKEVPVLIFKHSTRCSISSMTLGKLERSWSNESNPIKPYFLDLISFRNVSSAIAETFAIHHESPQAILIRDGKAVYHASHMQVSFEDLLNRAQ